VQIYNKAALRMVLILQRKDLREECIPAQLDAGHSACHAKL